MKTILIVDDSSFLRMIIRNIFKNHKILEAENGEEALRLFREAKPDVVLLDIVMPGKNGIAILRDIVKSDPQAKVIMVTAVGQDAVMEECRKLGATDYITKPFDEKTVLQTVEEYLQTK